MPSKKKYISGNKKIAIIKKSDDVRENLENTALVALRKRYLHEIKKEEELEHRLVRFNNTIKQKEIKDIIKIMKYYLRIED